MPPQCVPWVTADIQKTAVLIGAASPHTPQDRAGPAEQARNGVSAAVRPSIPLPMPRARISCHVQGIRVGARHETRRRDHRARATEAADAHYCHREMPVARPPLRGACPRAYAGVQVSVLLRSDGRIARVGRDRSARRWSWRYQRQCHRQANPSPWRQWGSPSPRPRGR